MSIYETKFEDMLGRYVPKKKGGYRLATESSRSPSSTVYLLRVFRKATLKNKSVFS